jgi:hypothetical protein
MGKKTLMKEWRMNKVQVVAHAKLLRVENNSAKVIPRVQQLLDIRNEKTEHTDEDETFLLTFVPAFKNLNDDQKYWAKMEMLCIIRKIKNNVFQTQDEQ